jgi:ornithine--oxo-acid transaminase
LGDTAEYLCKLLGFDKMLPMNGGVEACETAVKIARRWGYVSKGIPENQAVVLVAKGNFWGRTITASGACDDPHRYTNFGPFTPGFELVNYNDINDIRLRFELKGKNICAIMLEPIQGEAGVIIPDAGYLKSVKDLCKQHNILFILDEVQTGFGRTGKLMDYEWDDAKPDILAVAKALSGGMMPVSATFASDEIM